MINYLLTSPLGYMYVVILLYPLIFKWFCKHRAEIDQNIHCRNVKIEQTSLQQFLRSSLNDIFYLSVYNYPGFTYLKYNRVKISNISHFLVKFNILIPYQHHQRYYKAILMSFFAILRCHRYVTFIKHNRTWIYAAIFQLRFIRWRYLNVVCYFVTSQWQVSDPCLIYPLSYISIIDVQYFLFETIYSLYIYIYIYIYTDIHILF
jgi:hypothetical protein